MCVYSINLISVQFSLMLWVSSGAVFSLVPMEIPIESRDSRWSPSEFLLLSEDIPYTQHFISVVPECYCSFGFLHPI